MAGSPYQDLKLQGSSQKAVPGQDVPSSSNADDSINTSSAHLRRMKYFRKQFDQRRAYYYRQYLGQRDQMFYPDNITRRSNTYLPYPLSNVETITSRVMDAFFSFDPWFEVKPRTSQDDPACEKMTQVMHWMLKRSKLMDAFEELVRNIAIYGHSAIKVDWDFDFETVQYKKPIFAMQDVQQPVMDPQTGQPKMEDGKPKMQKVMDPTTGQPQQQPAINPLTGQPIIIAVVPDVKQVPKARPKFTAIDVYDLLVDPDGGIIAQLTEKSWGQMVRENQAYMALNDGKPLYDPDGMKTIQSRISLEKNPEEVIIRLAELWTEYDNKMILMTYGEDSDVYAWKDLRASYRATSYTPYKRRVFSGSPIKLFEGPNPFGHKRLPILHTSFIKLPNELYGLGAVEIISDVSESLNKFVNMITDNWNMGVNHRYVFDVNADIDHEALNSFNVPGGKVGVSGDPAKIIMPLPTFTPQQGDYMILDLYKIGRAHV